MRSINQVRILRFLQETGKEFTTKELQNALEKELDISYAILTRHLRALVDKNAVSRRFKDKGNAYKFNQWPEEEREFKPISEKDFKGLIKGTTSPEWQPTISKREVWEKIPATLLGLDSLFISASQGERIKQSDLDSLKVELRYVMEKVEGLRTVIGRLLTTDDLWNHRTLGGFLSE